MKRGDLVKIDTGVAPYEDGNLGLIITQILNVAAYLHSIGLSIDHLDP